MNNFMRNIKSFYQNYFYLQKYIVMNQTLDVDPLNNTMYSMQTKSFQNSKSNKINYEGVRLIDMKIKKKQEDEIAKKLATRINYLKLKQDNAMKKIYLVNQKLKDIEKYRSINKQHKQQQEDILFRKQKQKEEKQQFAKMLRQHLVNNKKIIFSLLNKKSHQDAKKFKNQKMEHILFSNTIRENSHQQNLRRIKKVRCSYEIRDEHKKMNFLEKMRNTESIKLDKEQNQNKLRLKKIKILEELESKEIFLEEKLKLSESFKQKCSEEYRKTKQKFMEGYSTHFKNPGTKSKKLINQRYENNNQVIIT